MGHTQQLAFDACRAPIQPLRSGLLKWVGNKQRFAHEIAACFPARFERYMEPFVGSGAVLATLAPPRAIASDAFKPLMEIWQTLSSNPECSNSGTPNDGSLCGKATKSNNTKR